MCYCLASKSVEFCDDITVFGVCVIVLKFEKARLESKFHPFNTSADAPKNTCIMCRLFIMGSCGSQN